MAKKKITTLESILEQSAILFLDKGFDKVTFADIAKKVGVSQPALYAYVDDKMDLLKQVCLWSAKVGQGYIDSRLNPRFRALDNLRLYFEANLHFFFEQQVHAHSIVGMYYFGISTSEIGDLYKLIRESAVSRIGTYIIQAQNESVLKTGSEKALAQALHVMLVGFCFRAIYAENKNELKTVVKDSWENVERLVSFYRI